MSKLIYTQTGDNNTLQVSFNGKSLGDLIIADDGFFYWFPEDLKGCIDSWVLKDIASKLDELNKVWNKMIGETLQEDL